MAGHEPLTNVATGLFLLLGLAVAAVVFTTMYTALGMLLGMLRVVAGG